MTERQSEENRTRFAGKAAGWDANPARVALARAFIITVSNVRRFAAGWKRPGSRTLRRMTRIA